MPLVIAHRGASAVEPENSLAAFRLALAQGADGIELDVHATADGDFAVFHDPVIGGRHIAELPLALVRRHRLVNGEPVPTLDEALAAITPEAIAFIEVKSMPPEADDALLARLDGAPRPDRCQVHAFDHDLVRRVGRRRPALPTGVLSEEYSVDPAAQVRAAGARALWQRADLIDTPLAALVREAGYALYAWTVDDPQRMRALLEVGVAGICTNRPEVAREVMG
ncbi:MAG: glycerophosphodiester phosphodiesterase [Gemmatimonadota bacterium]|nr:glycerophosphodiester phosphodiesterase [Gemmatimonadota bacterium]